MSLLHPRSQMQKDETEEDIKSWEKKGEDAAAAFLTLLFHQVQCCSGKEIEGASTLFPPILFPLRTENARRKSRKRRKSGKLSVLRPFLSPDRFPLSGLAALLIPFSLSVGCDPEKKSLMSSPPILFPFCVTDSHTTSSPILSSSSSGPLSNLPPSEDDAKTRRRHSDPTGKANFH